MPEYGIARRLGSGVQRFRDLFGALWRLEARFKGAQCHSTATFSGRPILSVAPHSKLILGARVNINSALRANPLACFQPSVLRTLAPGAELILADDAGISGAVICAGLSIIIGESAIIGSGAMLLDNDFHAFDPAHGWTNEFRLNARPIHIGARVFIGARAIILKGVTIGERAVIGAGSVVTRDVPAFHLAAGNPARIVPPKI